MISIYKDIISEIKEKWNEYRVDVYAYLALAELYFFHDDIEGAQNHLSEAYNKWVLEKDEKELLCWSTIIKARINFKQIMKYYSDDNKVVFYYNRALQDILKDIEQGLKLVRIYGYSLLHIDFLNLQARIYLLMHNVEEAEYNAKAALYGLSKAHGDENPYTTVPLNEETDLAQRGIFPLENSNQPELLAATHVQCGYVWGECEAREIIEKALLLRAARLLGRAEIDLANIKALAPEVQLLINEAWMQANAARRVRQRIGDPRVSEMPSFYKWLSSNMLTTFAPDRNQVFISYAHKDKKWVDRLKEMLKPLIRQNVITVWDDTQIKPGTLWKEEIAYALHRAKVAVLVGSSAFLASDFIDKHELQPLLQAARNDGVTILWFAVGAALYEESEIWDYQAIGDPSTPLEDLARPAQNAALRDICREIAGHVRQAGVNSRDR